MLFLPPLLVPLPSFYPFTLCSALLLCLFLLFLSPVNLSCSVFLDFLISFCFSFFFLFTASIMLSSALSPHSSPLLTESHSQHIFPPAFLSFLISFFSLTHVSNLVSLPFFDIPCTFSKVSFFPYFISPYLLVPSHILLLPFSYSTLLSSPGCPTNQSFSLPTTGSYAIIVSFLLHLLSLTSLSPLSILFPFLTLVVLVVGECICRKLFNKGNDSKRSNPLVIKLAILQFCRRFQIFVKVVRFRFQVIRAKNRTNNIFHLF